MTKNFREKLSDLMADLGLTQKDVAEEISSSKAAVSQWLSGRNLPSPMRQAEIAVALGQKEDYFSGNEQRPNLRWSVERMTPAEAAIILHMDKETICKGLRDCVFPWGYAVHMPSGRWVYWINRRKLLEEEKAKHE